MQMGTTSWLCSKANRKMARINYRFSLGTESDLEVITYLDGFTPKERAIVIKDALKTYVSNSQDSHTEKLNNIEQQIANIFTELKSIKNRPLTVTSVANIVDDSDAECVSEDDIDEATNNLMNILGD